MSIIYLLIACSLLVALVFLGGFIWSVRSNQYEDVSTPAYRILFDAQPLDERPEGSQATSHDVPKSTNNETGEPS